MRIFFLGAGMKSNKSIVHYFGLGSATICSLKYCCSNVSLSYFVIYDITYQEPINPDIIKIT